jgi:hypothetical protein
MTSESSFHRSARSIANSTRDLGPIPTYARITARPSSIPRDSGTAFPSASPARTGVPAAAPSFAHTSASSSATAVACTGNPE